jgi:hypothetical protein
MLSVDLKENMSKNICRELAEIVGTWHVQREEKQKDRKT